MAIPMQLVPRGSSRLPARLKVIFFLPVGWYYGHVTIPCTQFFGSKMKMQGRLSDEMCHVLMSMVVGIVVYWEVNRHALEAVALRAYVQAFDRVAHGLLLTLTY